MHQGNNNIIIEPKRFHWIKVKMTKTLPQQRTLIRKGYMLEDTPCIMILNNANSRLYTNFKNN